MRPARLPTQRKRASLSPIDVRFLISGPVHTAVKSKSLPADTGQPRELRETRVQDELQTSWRMLSWESLHTQECCHGRVYNAQGHGTGGVSRKEEQPWVTSTESLVETG